MPEDRKERMKASHTLELTVRLRDLDGVGHVNNATIVSFLEDARIDYLFTRRGGRSLRDIDFILARTEIDYRMPAHLHERLVVLLRPSRIGTKSFDLDYEIREKTSGRLVAEARTVQVAYDFAANRSVPLSDELRTLLDRDIASTT
jgi:acyl-CoA thioester hydrolase